MAQIQISRLPDFIDFSELQINKNECLGNSFKVSKKHPYIDMIEGIIIIVYPNNKAKILRHAWNKINDTHFDITHEKVWVEDDYYKTIVEIRYSSVKVIQLSEVNSNKIKFSEETNNLVKEYRLKLEERENKKQYE